MVDTKSIAFYTLGCKVNFTETSSITRLFKENDYTIKSFVEKADIYVINTCAVTQTAVKKSRYIINKALKANPLAQIVVTGCITETEIDLLKNENQNILFVGANEKHLLFDKIDKQLHEQSEDIETHFFSSYSTNDRTRSFLKIQDGCNYFCSYCIIPYARGRSRSDYISNILKNIQNILNEGVKEIVLTGINIGDFRNDKGETLLDVLKAIDNISGLERIRLSSLEPDLLTDDMINFIASSKVILPHFHLPLQAGANNVLTAMHRKYTTSLFANRIETVKKYMPNACIGTDVICGFPSETEDDFKQTISFLNNLPLSYLHVFPYSKREKTKACNIKNIVSSATLKERTQTLLSLANDKKRTFYLSQIETNHKVLFESSIFKGSMYGFTENYIKVSTPYNSQLVNQVLHVRLTHLSKKEDVFVIDLNEQ